MSAAKKASSSASRTRGRRLFKRASIALVVVLLAPAPMVLMLTVIDPPMTSIMLQQTADRLIHGVKPVWPQHTVVTRAGFSPNLRRAVLASEDDRFYLHHGIDMVEINNALERQKQGGKLRGASTLTQQVAKNIFLWNGRSFIRKGLELYLTLWLELILSKERILDLYLNLAEWGTGVYGAEAAARFHYHKSAFSLTREEAARLAAILPSPRKWTVSGSIAGARAVTILARMQSPAPQTAPAAK